jgi:hypothetical protein
LELDRALSNVGLESLDFGGCLLQLLIVLLFLGQFSFACLLLELIKLGQGSLFFFLMLLRKSLDTQWNQLETK